MGTEVSGCGSCSLDLLVVPRRAFDGQMLNPADITVDNQCLLSEIEERGIHASSSEDQGYSKKGLEVSKSDTYSYVDALRQSSGYKVSIRNTFLQFDDNKPSVPLRRIGSAPPIRRGYDCTETSGPVCHNLLRDMKELIGKPPWQHVLGSILQIRMDIQRKA